MKAILLIDMPDKCENCRFAQVTGSIVFRWGRKRRKDIRTPEEWQRLQKRWHSWDDGIQRRKEHRTNSESDCDIYAWGFRRTWGGILHHGNKTHEWGRRKIRKGLKKRSKSQKMIDEKTEMLNFMRFIENDEMKYSKKLGSLKNN